MPDPVFGINTILTSWGYLNPQNGTDTLWFTERSEKHTWVTLKLLTSKHDQVAKLTSLPFLLVILYPCFLIYFSEAPLTLPRCVSVSLTENVVRMCQERRRGRKRTRKRRKDKRKSVIMTSVCFTFNIICNLTHFSFNSSGWRHGMAVIQKQHRKAIHPTLVLCFFTLTLMFPLLPMVTFKHTIFHVESCYRNVWRALCQGAQEIMDWHTMLS